MIRTDEAELALIGAYIEGSDSALCILLFGTPLEKMPDLASAEGRMSAEQMQWYNQGVRDANDAAIGELLSVVYVLMPDEYKNKRPEEMAPQLHDIANRLAAKTEKKGISNDASQ